ncbi:MAG: glycosyltransferase family 1 protein [Flavobacteriaceae bacterium]|nr:MAG: glycosyltransferase family 1 protein [Flavobacteriaceae bacterium]
MHIGFITPEYPLEALSKSGGLGTSIKNLATSLAQNGVKTSVFVINQAQDVIMMDGFVEVHSIKTRKRPFAQWYFTRKQVNQYINAQVEEKNINILEAPDWTGITAFMKFTVPLIIRLNGSDGYFCRLDGRKQKWKNRFFERLALKGADRIISVSTFTGKMTNEVFGLKRNIKTIHNCINVSEFSPIEATITKGQILYFGTLVRKKGVLEIAPIFNEVVSKFDEASLLLIGNDNIDIFEHRSTLELLMENLSDKAKNRVNYLKAVPYEQVKKYISEANVIILPSYAEAFPMTWLETLSMEKALVSSNVGWANELMVDGKTGFTVDPKNHKEYAERIIKILNDAALCENLGKEGRKRVIENFSTEVITEQNLAFYESMI